MLLLAATEGARPRSHRWSHGVEALQLERARKTNQSWGQLTESYVRTEDYYNEVRTAFHEVSDDGGATDDTITSKDAKDNAFQVFKDMKRPPFHLAEDKDWLTLGNYAHFLAKTFVPMYQRGFPDRKTSLSEGFAQGDGFMITALLKKGLSLTKLDDEFPRLHTLAHRMATEHVFPNHFSRFVPYTTQMSAMQLLPYLGSACGLHMAEDITVFNGILEPGPDQLDSTDAMHELVAGFVSKQTLALGQGVLSAQAPTDTELGEYLVEKLGLNDNEKTLPLGKLRLRTPGSSDACTPCPIIDFPSLNFRKEGVLKKLRGWQVFMNVQNKDRYFKLHGNALRYYLTDDNTKELKKSEETNIRLGQNYVASYDERNDPRTIELTPFSEEAGLGLTDGKTYKLQAASEALAKEWYHMFVAAQNSVLLPEVLNFYGNDGAPPAAQGSVLFEMRKLAAAKKNDIKEAWERRTTVRIENRLCRKFEFAKCP